MIETQGIIIMTVIDCFWLLVPLGLSLYALHKARTEQKFKIFRSFAAGAFLVIFIYRSGPVVAKFILPFLMAR